MKHLGDITRLSGFTLPPVDVVTGGSPCQDLSIAGKRAGLAGERSGLFMEQTRIIKEMREADARRGRTADAIRPRWMVWENVAGAFSSNHGEDFRAVLEEIARIADGDAAIPRPAGGKWANAGAIVGDGWSIAWRVHDAQFWGVPQRRRRIAVVADFAGKCATEILFERKSVCGDFAAGGEAGQGAAAGAEMGTYKAIGFDGYNQQLTGDIAQTIRANKSDSDHIGMVLVPTVAHGLKAKANLSFREDADTLICTSVHLTQDPITAENVAPCLSSGNSKHGQATVGVCAAFMGGQGVKAGGIGYAEELSPTLKSTASGGNTVPCLCLAGNTIDRQPQNGGNGCGWQEDVSYTLTALDHLSGCRDNRSNPED